MNFESMQYLFLEGRGYYRMYGTMHVFECMKPYSDSQVMPNPIVTAMDEPVVNKGGLHLKSS